MTKPLPTPSTNPPSVCAPTPYQNMRVRDGSGRGGCRLGCDGEPEEGMERRELEGEIKGVGYVARKPLSQLRFLLDTNLPWYPRTAAPSKIHCPFVVRTTTRPPIANFSYPRAPGQPWISQPSSAPKPLTVTVHPQATGCLGGRASASVLPDNTRVNCAAPVASSRPRRRCETHTAPAPHRP